MALCRGRFFRREGSVASEKDRRGRAVPVAHLLEREAQWLRFALSLSVSLIRLVHLLSCVQDTVRPA